MRILIVCLFFLMSCTSTGIIRYERQQVKQANYEIGRAILPGALCLIGASMYNDTNRGKGVQSAVYCAAFVSIGAWDKKRKAKDYLISIGAAGVGFGIGSLYKYSVR